MKDPSARNKEVIAAVLKCSLYERKSNCVYVWWINKVTKKIKLFSFYNPIEKEICPL